MKYSYRAYLFRSLDAQLTRLEQNYVSASEATKKLLNQGARLMLADVAPDGVMGGLGEGSCGLASGGSVQEPDCGEGRLHCRYLH